MPLNNKPYYVYVIESDNFDYTAIGDTVNLAARLESLNKHYKTDILISNRVNEGIKNSDFFIKEVDSVMVKGKDTPTTIYTIIFEKQFNPDYIEHYKKGIKMFKMGNFNFAIKYFEECLNLDPNDEIVRIYIERCKDFISNPPSDWKGVVQLNFK